MHACRALARSLVVAAIPLLCASRDAAAKTATPPPPDPADFVSVIDNPFMPLAPGTTLEYEGETEGVPSSDTFKVTHRTVKIQGVTCVVVQDDAYEDGVLVETTSDYFAQDRKGNVWYFGEDTEELDENGDVISTEGTWRAGVDGARAGIAMEAHPKVGDTYAQEEAPGVAVDQAKVLSLDESLCVPYACFDSLLETKEWTPLERAVVEHKYYAAGIGFVYGEMVKGGDETTALVSVTKNGRD